MQGSLKQVPLPEVLQFISMGKSSGILKLRRHTNEISLTIHSGRIINSSAIDRRRRIGDLLVNRGLLKRSELSRLLQVQRSVESDKRLGQILVERDIVSEDTIREALRLQLEEEIWNLFGWDDGEFTFDAVPEDQLGDEIVTIHIEPLILEGTRRNDEWQKIIAIIPNDRLIPRVAKIGDSFKRTLELQPEEWTVLSHVNGSFTVRAIVNRSNLGRFEAYRIMTQFIKSGLIEIHSPEELAAKEEESHPRGADEGNGKKTADAPKAPMTTAARTSTSGKGKLFGSLRGKRERGDHRTQLEFLSPIGALAYLIGELFSRVRDEKEFSPQEGDDDLLDRIWFDLVQVYTKADLIVVEVNQVDPWELETYLGGCEFTEVVDECYEDAFEGLMHLLRATYQVLGKRVGERSVNRIMRELLDETAPRLVLKYRDDSPLAERIQMVLKLTG